MSNRQKNPYKFLYEPGAFDGIPVIGTGANPERSLIPEGLYYYDICNSGDMENASEFCIVQEPIPEVAKGCIIAAAPIDFHGKTERSLDDMRSDKNAYMMSLKEFADQHISKEMNETPENELIQM
ncbi:LPD28 domain-containing protein [Hungatella effluvii]|uniref:LPD28 domain-containing protein n=1 Tax=Hungatella effluvii TaxID=1096246 RepID=UPI0022E22A59|nr:LPD28 domain-containing protein [Hungatella effluvii]